MDVRTRGGEVCDRAHTRGENHGCRESAHPRHFCDRKDVLYHPSEADPEVVDYGEKDDYRRREAFHAKLVERRDLTDERKMQGPPGNRSDFCRYPGEAAR